MEFTIAVFLAINFVIISQTPKISADLSIFQPHEGTIPFLVYYTSRYRATCLGSLVSRRVVITAAVCLADAYNPAHDKRPITVVTSTAYRHQKRGVRIPVIRVFIPTKTSELHNRTHHLQHSVALMQLREAPPDYAGDFRARAIEIDYESGPNFKEECFTVGWNFYTGYPVIESKFLLQKYMHALYLTVERGQKCYRNHIHFLEALNSVGYNGPLEHSHFTCTIDAQHKALPCHGMYGSPLVCRGRLMGIMTAPDGQMPNCTDGSIYHLLSTENMQPFLECMSSLFRPDRLDFSAINDDQSEVVEDDIEDYYDYAIDSDERLNGE